MSRTGLYPGSFDPVTYGHLDIIGRALHVFDKVIVAVANNPFKKSMFTADERVGLLREATKDMDRVEVASFDVLTVEYAHEVDAVAIIRGLRAMSDFEYEFQMALTNRALAPEIEIIYMMPQQPYTFVSSTMAKELALFDGDIDQFVPPCVAKVLREKAAEKKAELERLRE
jgi:pantetheine-phosphate adenylyltransferase